MTTKNQLRIIAGKWRGRKIHFPDLPYIRPTPDRVRETLFNWLQDTIHGARCLDLFAGSGALGLEALSRGASHVTFVDQSTIVTKHLKNICNELQISNVDIIQAKIPETKLSLDKFDIVFLDPPFSQNLIQPCLDWLEKAKILNKKAYIYVEKETSDQNIDLPNNWQIAHSKTAGKVCYNLITVTL